MHIQNMIMRYRIIQLAFLFSVIFANAGYSQTKRAINSNALYFLSDCQQPIIFEEILLKPYKNIEGRDSLFTDILKHNPESIFLLGDMVSKGSSRKKWTPIDKFLVSLKERHGKVYPIPGNHEYLVSAGKGMKNYLKRFPAESLQGYCVRTDSLAIVMLNSNFKKMTPFQRTRQNKWFLKLMDSLDIDKSVLGIVVCTHHAPYSNSKVVGSSTDVQKEFLPHFINSAKAKLFITGHSHNLEYFKIQDKDFLVIGGGGGLAQPLLTGDKQIYKDRVSPDEKPLFFYITLLRSNKTISIYATGLDRRFDHISTRPIGEIHL